MNKNDEQIWYCNIHRIAYLKDSGCPECDSYSGNENLRDIYGCSLPKDDSNDD